MIEKPQTVRKTWPQREVKDGRVITVVLTLRKSKGLGFAFSDSASQQVVQRWSALFNFSTLICLTQDGKHEDIADVIAFPSFPAAPSALPRSLHKYNLDPSSWQRGCIRTWFLLRRTYGTLCQVWLIRLHPALSREMSDSTPGLVSSAGLMSTALPEFPDSSPISIRCVYIMFWLLQNNTETLRQTQKDYWQRSFIVSYREAE